MRVPSSSSVAELTSCRFGFGVFCVILVVRNYEVVSRESRIMFEETCLLGSKYFCSNAYVGVYGASDGFVKGSGIGVGLREDRCPNCRLFGDICEIICIMPSPLLMLPVEFLKASNTAARG